jgi:hypothetical protein
MRIHFHESTPFLAASGISAPLDRAGLIRCEEPRPDCVGSIEGASGPQFSFEQTKRCKRKYSISKSARVILVDK